MLFALLTSALLTTPGLAQPAEPDAASQITPKPLALDPAAEAAMRIEKPLMTEAEESKFRVKLFRYQSAVRGGDLEDKDLLRQGISYRLQRMTLPSHRNELEKRRRDMLRDVSSAGSLAGSDAKTAEFRKFMLGEVLNQATQLLDNNYYVRLNAVILISQLSTVEPDYRGQGGQAYTPAASVLMPLLSDDDQPYAVKIWAAKGLGRILKTGDPKDMLRHQIAQAIIGELTTHPDSLYWYQERLIEALGGVGIVNYGQDRAFAINALAKILVDRKRHPVARTEAAKQIGRVPLDANVNLEVVAYGLAGLAHDLLVEQNAKPKAAYWQRAFLDNYLAYKPLDEEEQQQQAGLFTKVAQQPGLQKYGEVVKESFDVSLPVFKVALANANLAPLPLALAKPIRAWLDENKPSNLRIYPELTPLVITRDVASRPDSGD